MGFVSRLLTWFFGGFPAFYNEFTYGEFWVTRTCSCEQGLLGLSDIYAARAWIISPSYLHRNQIENPTLSRASCHFPLRYE
jgi:hypothetical protein